jgi:hypothetical protein
MSKNGGSAGTSGHLVFSSGTSGSGNTGKILIGTSASSDAGTDSKGGSIVVSVGKSLGSTTGNSMTLSAGGTDAASSTGGNIYLTPGHGTTNGAVLFKASTTAGAATFGTISDSTVDFSTTTVSLVATGTAALSSGTTLTLTGTTGISMGASRVYNFETDMAVAASDTPTSNKMTGMITTATTNLAASTELAITVTNSRVTTSSLIFVTPEASGCADVVFMRASAGSGSFTATFKNSHATTACTTAFKFFYMVIN